MAGLNLLTAIVISWNIAHLGEAVRQRQHAGLTVEPELVAHIILTSEYRWPKRDNRFGGVSVRFCPLPESTRAVPTPDPGGAVRPGIQRPLGR